MGRINKEMIKTFDIKGIVILVQVTIYDQDI